MKIIKDNKEYSSIFDYVKADLQPYIDLIADDLAIDHLIGFSNDLKTGIIKVSDTQINNAIALIDLNTLNAFDNEGFDYDTNFIVLNDNGDPVDTEQFSSLILDNLEAIITSDHE